MNELAITGDKLDLIKRTVAKDASDDELELFLYQCKRTGLDPLLKQIYCVKRKGQMAIQTAIDGFRLVADRTGKYAGNDDPLFDSEQKPHKATVTVYKMVEGQRCAFTASARWGEYYPGDGPDGFFWRKMPCGQLGKCAEALALRKAFPADLSGIYTHEEMGQADNPAPSRQYALAAEPNETLPKDNWVKKLETTKVEEPARSPDQEEWIGVIKEVVHVPKKPNWKSRLHWVNMEDGKSAGTWEETLAGDAEIVAGQGEVKVKVQRSKRDSSKFEYLGFEPLEAVAKSTQDELGWNPE